MQFSALFCLVGRDNGQRFAVISGLIFFVLLLAAVILGSTAALYVVGILLLPILGLTSYRRLRDSGKTPRLIALTLAPFILVLLTLVHIDSVMLLLTFMVFAALAIGYIAILPSISKASYRQGYSGPIKIVDRAAAKGSRVRVEPTLTASESHQEAATTTFSNSETDFEAGFANGSATDSPAQEASLSSSFIKIQRWLMANQKMAFSGVAALLVCMLLLSVWSLIPNDDASAAEQATTEIETLVKAPAVERKMTTLPDGFSLVLEDDVLIVRWLGETGSPTTLWSLATAKGDRTCAALKFNNGTEYRPVEVSLLADTGTEARFSPLDTEAIIVDMARRGNVSLCGYNFSLKGSQAAIGKVAAFATYL
ncbi:DUF805 domain-containing protein [Shewanella kaireitica]|uniref:DUF805 domain-containing protein n=1 Tax=Shewanella kaireitica TaxID=212021 RepID=UPI00200BA670|nr:DUF805 domain-containing protein [Shewanella kaireitica]MCL1094465.1 DUF805 domain-containing protein [Shewanella kaireitica]